MAKKKIPAPNRHTPKKSEPFVFTPEMKRWLIIAAAVIALVVIFFVVRYNMAALSLDADGNIITAQGENWLVYNEKTRDNPRYIKFGQVSPAEGYSLDRQDFLTDKNEPIYYFKADDDSALTYAAMIGKGDYATIAQSTITSVTSMLEGSNAGEVVQDTLSGRKVSYYIYDGAARNAEDPEIIDYYSKHMNAYAQGPNNRCVVFMLEQRSDTGSDYQEDADFVALLEKALAGLQL